jgi:hypothetical protein
MLKVANINDPEENFIAPSVYIDSIVLENKTMTVHYSLRDLVNSWMLNDLITDNLFVYISDGKNTDKRLLKTIIKANKISDNTVKDYASFTYINDFTSSLNSTTIQAWCGNENISSSIVTEQVIISGSLVKAKYNNLENTFLNKTKNLNLLNFNIIFPTGSLSEASESPIVSDLMVSYRPDKKSNLSFVFDLQSYLKKTSKQYNFLQKNSTFRQIILANSSIDVDKSYFKKYNLSIKDFFGSKISNKIEAQLIDTNSYKYLISVADDNLAIQNRHYYDIEAHLEVIDYSSKLLSDVTRQNIRKSIIFLEEYRNNFNIAYNNSFIQNPQIYIFENFYEEHINNGNISNLIDTLAPVCSLFSGIKQEQFAELFVSIIHPLNTEEKLITKLIDFMYRMESVVVSAISTAIDASNISYASNKKGRLIVDKRFSVSTQNVYASDLNYDYDENTGIEVILSDSLETISNSINPSVYTFTEAEFFNRKFLESKKYFNNPGVTTRQAVNTFSIANFFINGSEYNLIINPPEQDNSFFNDIFTKVKESKYPFRYKAPETYVFQLLQEGVNIKTITNRNSNSTNNIKLNTLFDNNQDSLQNSLKFMTDTNVRGLYFIIDDTDFLPLEEIKDSIQYNSTRQEYVFESPKKIYNEESLKDFEQKAKLLIYYNSIYKLNVVSSGDLMDVYTLIPTRCLSNIFTDNLRLLTTNFIVRKKFITPTEPPLQFFNIVNDLKINIPSIYLNRNITKAAINITVDDI